jgi:hypothetical protein
MNPHLKESRMLALLRSLYSETVAQTTAQAVGELIARHAAAISVPARTELSERDALLITYADQVRAPGVPPLQTLAAF